MKRRTMVSAGLICFLLLGQAAWLAGCGERTVSADEAVELIEPMQELSGSETAALRDLYSAGVYDVLVEPYVEEYSYEENRNFLSSDFKIGDFVKAGDIVYRTNVVSAEEKIEKLQEKLDDLTKSYEEYRKETEEKLESQRRDMEVAESELEGVEEEEPENISSQAYAAWEKERDKAQGNFNKKELDFLKSEEALRQRRELYELDYRYYAGQINDLRRQNENGVLRAGMDGKIMAMELHNVGDKVSAGASVVTLADMGRKKLAINYSGNTGSLDISNIFAFFNGRRYQVAFDYDETTKSTVVFSLEDPAGEVPVGSYGKLVMYTWRREQVVTVSNEAIHRSATGQFVYVLKDGQTEVRTIRIGRTDGVYTEILSGLGDGEAVLIDRSAPKAVNTEVLAKGRDCLNYFGNGTIHYPLSFNVQCGVKHGTVIFDRWPEYKGVLRNGQPMEASSVADVYYVPMKAGDVVARINVELSEQEKLELQQKENNLKRLRERFNDFIADGTEGKEKAVASRQEAIDKAQEELNELYRDYNTTEVKTERDGLLIAVQRQISRRNVVQGDVMADNFVYAYMADLSVAYLLLPNSATFGTLGYDTVLEVSYVNWEGETVTRQARVINVGISNYSQALLLDEETMRDMNLYTEPGANSISRLSYQSTMAVTGEVKVMENVVMLPGRALSQVNGSCAYVNVLEQDGSIRTTSVLLGGQAANTEDRRNYYWVIDGLTEGMTVCWE